MAGCPSRMAPSSRPWWHTATVQEFQPTSHSMAFLVTARQARIFTTLDFKQNGCYQLQLHFWAIFIATHANQLPFCSILCITFLFYTFSRDQSTPNSTRARSAQCLQTPYNRPIFSFLYAVSEAETNPMRSYIYICYMPTSRHCTLYTPNTTNRKQRTKQQIKSAHSCS